MWIRSLKIGGIMKKSNSNWWMRTIVFGFISMAIALGDVKYGLLSFAVLMTANHFLKISDQYEHDE